MSKFGDLINGTETVESVEIPVVEEAPVIDTAPASVEDPVDPEPLDLSSLSKDELEDYGRTIGICLLYTSPSPRDGLLSRMPSSA